MTDLVAPHLIERAVKRMRQRRPPDVGGDVLLDPVDHAVAPAGSHAPPARTAPSIRLELDALRRAGIVVLGERRSRAAEEWRVIADMLQRRQQTAYGRSLINALMLTSSRPAEGKSFCALNLAATIARGGSAAVLLVDLDDKPDSLTGLLGLADQPGLHDLVAGQASGHGSGQAPRQGSGPGIAVEDVLVATAQPNLSILPIGRPTAAERGRGVTRAAIATLERIARCDPDRLLILDTAPCLASSDAAALAPHVGQIAMIVEAQRTQRGELDSALDLLATCETISLVLNKARAGATSQFGSYYDRYGRNT